MKITITIVVPVGYTKTRVDSVAYTVFLKLGLFLVSIGKCLTLNPALAAAREITV